jgi:drug/metabolite transporter (DMT)-like permease
MIVFAAIGVYFAIGFAVSLAFAVVCADKLLDRETAVSPGARVLLIPGAMVLWPIVISRWWREGLST